MVLFPCLQFGGQEFDDPQKVLNFANQDKSFQGTVMSIGDVVGENARDSWKFFYEQTNAEPPGWNFKGKFLVDRTGKVKPVEGNLVDEIKALLGSDEL